MNLEIFYRKLLRGIFCDRMFDLASVLDDEIDHFVEQIQGIDLVNELDQRKLSQYRIILFEIMIV